MSIQKTNKDKIMSSIPTLQEDLAREIIQSFKMLEREEKEQAYLKNNVTHLSKQIAENPSDKDLQTRLEIAVTATKVFENSSSSRTNILNAQIGNGLLDYHKAGGTVSDLAKNRYPDNAEKREAFGKKITSRIEPLIHPSHTTILAILLHEILQSRAQNQK